MIDHWKAYAELIPITAYLGTSWQDSEEGKRVI